MAALTTPTLIQPNEVVNGGVLKPTPLSARFDVTLIAPHIEVAMERHVIPVICQAFYDVLLLKKANRVSNYNTVVGTLTPAFVGTDTALEAFWRKYLLDFCALAVYYEAIPYLTLQTGSNGIITPQVQYGQSASVSSSKYLQDTVMDRLNFLGSRIRKYLCDNHTDFPDFCYSSLCEQACGCGDEKTTNLTGGNFGLFYV
jgi:hypothetical protein